MSGIKTYEVKVDLNKLKRPSDMLDAELVNKVIIPEIKRLLGDENVTVEHLVDLPGSEGYNLLKVSATGSKPNGFQQRVTAAATTALRSKIAKRAS